MGILEAAQRSDALIHPEATEPGSGLRYVRGLLQLLLADSEAGPTAAMMAGLAGHVWSFDELFEAVLGVGSLLHLVRFERLRTGNPPERRVCYALSAVVLMADNRKIDIITMPRVEVLAFCEKNGHSPLNELLKKLKKNREPAYRKCVYLILALSLQGRELRFPQSKHLVDDIWELRGKATGVLYRLLYSFTGSTVSVISHGVTKTDVVPPLEIKLAADRIKIAKRNPKAHTCEIKAPNEQKK